MLNEAEKKRLAELYSASYERFFSETKAAAQARSELAELLLELHRRECPNQPYHEFRNGCTSWPNSG